MKFLMKLLSNKEETIIRETLKLMNYKRIDEVQRTNQPSTGNVYPMDIAGAQDKVVTRETKSEAKKVLAAQEVQAAKKASRPIGEQQDSSAKNNRDVRVAHGAMVEDVVVETAPRPFVNLDAPKIETKAQIHATALAKVDLIQNLLVHAPTFNEAIAQIRDQTGATDFKEIITAGNQQVTYQMRINQQYRVRFTFQKPEQGGNNNNAEENGNLGRIFGNKIFVDDWHQ
jgi:hypothetical protein